MQDILLHHIHEHGQQLRSVIRFRRLTAEQGTHQATERTCLLLGTAAEEGTKQAARGLLLRLRAAEEGTEQAAGRLLLGTAAEEGSEQAA